MGLNRRFALKYVSRVRRMENLTQNNIDVRGDEKSPARFTCINCKFRSPKDGCLRPSFEIPCYYGSPLEEVPEIYKKREYRQATLC